MVVTTVRCFNATSILNQTVRDTGVDFDFLVEVVNDGPWSFGDTEYTLVGIVEFLTLLNDGMLAGDVDAAVVKEWRECMVNRTEGVEYVNLEA